MKISNDPIHNIENLIAQNTTKNMSIYILSVIILIGFIISLPIIEVDINSHSRGIVRSSKESVPINTVISGKVIKNNISANKSVVIKDTLLIITNKTISTQKSLNDSILKHNLMELKDYEFLLRGVSKDIQDITIKIDYNRFISQKQELQSKIERSQLNYTRYKELFNKNVVAQIEYEKHKYELKNAQQKLNQLIKQEQANWQIKKHQLEESVQNLRSKSIQFDLENEKHFITAPISGTLENVLGLQIGSFVYATQPLATISPNGNLIVENKVHSNDIGLLKIGQDVKFQFDAFNYNQWSLVSGKVIDIDKNITVQNDISFFKVRCSLDTKQIALKNGYTKAISKGMTLTTRYFISRRSLFDLLFDKVDDWINPNII